MADINVSMPTDNEDFDATTSTSGPVPESAPTPITSDSFSAQPASMPEAETPVTTEPEAPASETVAPQAPETVEATSPTPPAPEVVETAAPEVVAPVMAPVTPKTKKPLPLVPILGGLAVLLILAVAGLGVYAQGLSSDKTKLQAQVTKLNANPQLLVQKQTDELIATVGKLTKLPTGETPTVANVSDAAKAKQQSAFFNNAQNGDRVLMYVKAGQAILFRPSTNKIILIAPLTFNNTATPAASSTTTK